MGAPSTQQNLSTSNKLVDRTEPPTNDHQRLSTNNNSSSAVDDGNVSDLISTYSALIQQYLSVMCLDNATFLAERLVATSKTNETLYLLALCYDRSGSPQRALSVLDDCKVNLSSFQHGSSSAAQYLKAKCYYDLKQFGHAEDALLLQARTLYRQLRLASDAAGTEPPMPMDSWILATTPCPIPNGAVGLYLLGNVCRRSNRKQRAIQYFHMSLQLDPLLWSSYEALCEMGCNDAFMDPNTLFGVRSSNLTRASQNSQQQLQKVPMERGVLTPSVHQSHTPMGAKLPQIMDLGTPLSTVSSIQKIPKATVLFQTASKSNKRGNAGTTEPVAHAFDTPDLTPIPLNQSFQPHFSNRPGQHAYDSLADSINPSVVRRARQVAAQLYYEPSPESPHLSRTVTTRYFLRGLEKPPTSTRLSFSTVIPDTATPQLRTESTVRRGGLTQHYRQPQQLKDSIATSSVGGASSFHRQIRDASSHCRKPRNLFPSSENRLANGELEGMERHDRDGQRDDTTGREIKQPEVGDEEDEVIIKGVFEILKLFSLLGAAHWRLCQFQCRQALQLFHQLPEVQFNTGWVLHQVGRAYFEMVDYQSAHRAFERMQHIEPHRMKGLEVLSTTLWHLKKEIELAHLAQRVIDFDRLCTEAWCVVGNCFSLQKEHETALVYLGRSIQIDPGFTYSHTLSGCEYLASEDFEKAVACFRTAIRSDDRHYNAWYGLGTIYHKQEKYDLAEYHFHKAVTINPQSSVLRCNLGMTQHANGKPHEALETLAAALNLEPRNPQARYQRATIYMSMDRPELALEELERVRDAAPREASVHFALGRVLKRLRRPHQAMKCFLTALDLDPKDNQLIKSAMDKLDEPDIDEEVVAF